MLENISLADKVWFCTGGKARFFVEPKTADEFAAAVKFATEKELAIHMLGLGANTLVSDTGFDGLVIRPALKTISQQKNGADVFVTAGAGVTIEELINWGFEHNVVGLEEFSGIPGTIGGSVFINIHYFDCDLSHMVYAAKLMHRKTGELIDVDREWFDFKYDYSRLHDEPYVVVEATLKLKVATDIDVAFARGRSVEIIRHRAHRYPTVRTCGSFFQNFSALTPGLIELNGKKITAVAYYLDQLGLKGAVKGKASVSTKHANMIVTAPGATSQDVIDVAQHMQQKMRDVYGLTPQPECQFVGFSEYPLFLNV